MSILGIATGMCFATFTSGRRCKKILRRHGIKVHGLHLNKGRHLFWVSRADAQRAVEILEKRGISVGEWD